MNTETEIPDSERQLQARWATAGARVLLAEDDREMQDMVASALRRDGYDVVTARDGGELLLRLASSAVRDADETYDLVVSDVRMPVCSGLHVLEALRRAQSSMPVILMTAFGDDATRAVVEGYGGVLFDKPFDLDDLRTAVLHLLRDGSVAHVVDAPPALLGDDPILVLVATTESSLDAWAVKWMLKSEGIESFLGGRALVSTAESTEVYVLKGDVARARALIARYHREPN